MDSLTVRDEISEYWLKSDKHLAEPTYGFDTADHYDAFCIAKDWLQDTSEAIMAHRKAGFSGDPLLAYIEFWGVLQAVIVHQDAICELDYSVSETRKKASELLSGNASQEIRQLRNLAAGHPTLNASRLNGPARSVTGRLEKTYDQIDLMVSGDSNVRIAKINLGKMIDRYDAEATVALRSIKEKFVTKFPHRD
ncbi:hypothetical protein [Sinisalibacter aestuarii]|uniref:Uncharacterized protein n=1 Tax=Sinisalibacter aestuarii TaxID=2949426 RepID=A0ABQ5LUA6_9RHOB|nr:hypothetical protein [Sinisalibacter aestuarii]GKY88550.1 hypothetical protein STA1M1_24190 [Sinisalibacter aestuarii]